VAPELGAVLESGRRGAIAIALPHLPDDPAARPPGGAEGPQRRDVHRGFGVPDGADSHHRRDDGAGVLERYPRLRVSFAESGAGWLGYALHCMDFVFEDRFRDLMKLRPSEYWRRQCKATFQFDPISSRLVDEIGVETMMWGSDYPHTDGIWPESSRYIEEQFAGLSPEIVHKITCENAAKFYNLINEISETHHRYGRACPGQGRGLRRR
jgi:predicted TIM-barrel fold metal-dependent hydrolase